VCLVYQNSVLIDVKNILVLHTFHAARLSKNPADLRRIFVVVHMLIFGNDVLLE